MRRRSARALLLLLGIVLLAGCGQKGPLVLPPPKPVVAAPAPPAAHPAPAHTAGAPASGNG